MYLSLSLSIYLSLFIHTYIYIYYSRLALIAADGTKVMLAKAQ